MKVFDIAVFIITINIGMALVTASGLFGEQYYENKLIDIQTPGNVSALSESEQYQATIASWNTVLDALTWGWIKYYVPFYQTDTAVRYFVDALIRGLQALTSIIVVAGVIEFIRNRTEVFR